MFKPKTVADFVWKAWEMLQDDRYFHATAEEFEEGRTPPRKVLFSIKSFEGKIFTIYEPIINLIDNIKFIKDSGYTLGAEVWFRSRNKHLNVPCDRWSLSSGIEYKDELFSIIELKSEVDNWGTSRTIQYCAFDDRFYFSASNGIESIDVESLTSEIIITTQEVNAALGVGYSDFLGATKDAAGNLYATITYNGFPRLIKITPTKVITLLSTLTNDYPEFRMGLVLVSPDGKSLSYSASTSNSVTNWFSTNDGGQNWSTLKVSDRAQRNLHSISGSGTCATFSPWDCVITNDYYESYTNIDATAVDIFNNSIVHETATGYNFAAIGYTGQTTVLRTFNGGNIVNTTSSITREPIMHIKYSHDLEDYMVIDYKNSTIRMRSLTGKSNSVTITPPSLDSSYGTPVRVTSSKGDKRTNIAFIGVNNSQQLIIQGVGTANLSNTTNG